MKIGTLTFSNSKENYGQILQCYALVEFLRSLGHDSFLIRAKHCARVDSRSFWKKKFCRAKWLLHPLKYYGNYLEKRETDRQHNIMETDQKKHPRYFDDFIKKNIPSTEKWYDDITIFNNTPEADAYVCGSDQIWGGDDSYMYLQFARSNQLKIAYAASFGGLIPNHQLLNRISNYLSDFSWVTLREQTGTDLCKKIGVRNPETVPDPTLLLEVGKYKSLYRNSLPIKRSPFIFLYLLGNQIPLDVDKIFNFAQKHNLNVVYVGAHGRHDNYPKEYPTIEEWLQLIECSDYVITNSYHGTIFSILYHKKFLTIPLVGIRSRMNTRLDELLARYELKNRLYKSSLDSIFDAIDYSLFERVNNNEKEYVKSKMSQILKESIDYKNNNSRHNL